MKFVLLTGTIITIMVLPGQTKSQEICGRRGICKCSNMTQRLIVNCAQRKLSKVPENIPTYVTDLYLQHNKINYLPTFIFWKLHDLRRLDLSYNKLQHLSRDIFAENACLQQLYLKQTSIKDVPSGLFRNNKHLQKVDLSYNQLEHIEEGIFANNTELERVYLRNTSIKSLPRNIFRDCLALKKVDVSFNQLPSIAEETFERNEILENIDLSNNNLEDVPENIFANNTQLQELNLTCNKIRTMPENVFLNNRNFQKLSMRRNLLESLSAEIFRNAPLLMRFDVSFNNISNIPETIFKRSSKLEFLYIQGNNLETLPDLLFQSTSGLISLYLGRNNLHELQSNVFENLHNLKTLDLSFNRIKILPCDVFSCNAKLENFYFTHNSLERVPSGLFKNMSALTTLNLAFNQLERLPSDVFINNWNLHTLNLHENHLEELPKDIFKNSVKLQILAISHNKLWSLDSDVFATATSLKDLEFGGNRLKEIPGDLLLSTPNIKHLRLCFNQLRVIPQNLFTSVRDLRDLAICENRLIAVNKTVLQGSDQLYYLSLHGNMLSSLPVDLFSDVTLHGIVLLSDNNLTEIPAGLFCSNRCSHKLEWLFLHNNSISYLPKNCFQGLQQIKHIFLNNNKIVALADDVFAGTRTQYIYMFSNNLREISNNSLRNNYIHEIQLYKNPIEMLFEEAFLATKGSLKLYIDCGELLQIPWFSKNITTNCLKNRLPPTINLSGSGRKTIKAILIRDGFNCTDDDWSPKCSPCPPGSYSDGINGCLPCPAGGFYQDDFGRLECKTCTNGAFVKDSAGKSMESCELCPDGTNLTRHAGYRACFCKMNYSRTHRFEGCSLCLEEGLNCSQDYKSLLTGYYWNWTFPGANVTEYSNFVLHLRNDSLHYNASSKEYLYNIPKVHECPLRYSCENKGSFTAVNITGSCRDGYRGWLCSKCQSRFYSILNICIPCPDKVWIILEIIAILLLGAGLYVSILWQNKRQKKGNTNDRSLIDKISSQMKIVLGFYQVVGELFESFHDIAWVGPFKLLGELITFLKVNILRVIIRPHCYSENLKVNVKIQFIISLSFPLVVNLFFILFYYIWKICLKFKFRNATVYISEKLKNLREKLCTYALLLLFITYPPTCDVIFKLYPGACKTFYIYEDDTSVNITLLRSDFDLECKSLKYYQIFAYIATVTYVVAFPCVLLYLLQKYRKRTVTIEPSDDDLDSIQNQPDDAVSERSCLIRKNCKQADIPVWIKFLCENYKPQFWYWEIIELARKVTQTVLVTLLGFEDVLTKLLTVGLSVMFLTLHAKLSPMTSNFEQRLQMFSLTAIFVNVLIASVPIPQNYQAPLSTILILMNMIIVLVIAGEIVLYITRIIKHKMTRKRKHKT